MKQYLLMFLQFFFFIQAGDAQIRNGWSPVYDKDGHLTRMFYYVEGEKVSDSTMIFQYHSDNVLKALIRGDFMSTTTSFNGSMSLYDETGRLKSFMIKQEGDTFFDSSCDQSEGCHANWIDDFNVASTAWVGDSHYLEDGSLVIENNKGLAYVIYKPEIPIDLQSRYAFRFVLSLENNAKTGILINWEDKDNFILFELSFGRYYSIYRMEDGVISPIKNGRNEIENVSDDQMEVVIRHNASKVIFEINGRIETITNIEAGEEQYIGLMSRSNGRAYFNEFLASAEIPAEEILQDRKWLGKGSGFFISSNTLLTAYDVVMDAQSLRVKFIRQGKIVCVPATLLGFEEKSNLAVLQLQDYVLEGFESLPFGYSSQKPRTDGQIFSYGFPHAISGKYDQPKAIEGSISNDMQMIGGNRCIELPFRYGMLGAPVFDGELNLVGICAYRGKDLNHTGIVDFFENRTLFQEKAGMNKEEYNSPYSQLRKEEKLDVLKSIVVLVESSMF